MTHRSNRVPAALLVVSAALGAGLALTGCTHAENDRFRFGESGLLPAFDARPDTIADPTPTVTGHDRSGWEPMVFVVPVHGTAHQPTYAPGTFDLATLPRQRGEYPTAETCLDLSEPDGGAEAWLAARTHGMALVDTVMLVPRAIMRPPTATDWSPGGNYTRVSGQDAAVAEIEAHDESAAADSYDPTEGFFDEADS
jgi:hypothetical protein